MLDSKEMSAVLFRTLSIALILSIFSIIANSQATEFLKPAALTECSVDNPLERLILYEYGAVYMSRGAILPSRCRFSDKEELSTFTKRFAKDKSNKLEFGDFYLQPRAKQSLEYVFNELGGYGRVARNCNGRNGITCDKTTLPPKVNDDWALRTFEDTALNWHLDLTLDKKKQEERILADLVDVGNLKPKMFGSAIPGGSQHHLGLAIDVNDTGSQICGPKCVAALERNGWFRTVRFDPYHFTFLGALEFELPLMGLKRVTCQGFNYWVPNVSRYSTFAYAKGGCR